MNNTVAVLLPVYKKDNPQFFLTTVDSLLAQTLQDFKIFLGVDGPIEGELDKVLKGCEKNEKFCVIRFKENRGLASVLNDLIVAAVEQGHMFFARMDADDICVNTRFEMQMAYLQSHPDVDVVGGKIEEIDENGNLNGKAVQYPLTHDDCRRFFRYRDPLAHPATFFRKSYFDKVAAMNKRENIWYRPEYRKNQDTMLWFDGFRSGCVFANLPETVLHFRVAPDFYGRRNGWKRAKQMIRSRMDINKAMKYDISANLFAIAMALMTVSPTCLKKFLYKIR